MAKRRGTVILSVDRANLNEARADALRLIRAIIADAPLGKPVDMDRAVTITDQLGAHLLTVSFRDALD